MDREELEKILSANINNRSFVGFIEKEKEDEEDFGTLKNIEVLKRGVSGKVISLKITTDKNSYTVSKELIIRQLFKKDGKNLPSANIVFEFIKTSDNMSKKVEGNEQEETSKNDNNFEISKIKVYGGGLGHGVGMSQFGAGKMHSLGYTYDKILQHYYTGISITTPKVVLSDKKETLTDVQSFYTEEPKGFLYIKNFSAPSKVTVNVNGNAFDFEFTRHSKPNVYTEISPYMFVGKNYVSYTLSGDNKNKKASMYIELKGAVNE